MSAPWPFRMLKAALKLLLSVLAGAMALFFSTAAHADKRSDTGVAQATIVEPIRVTSIQPLDFGAVQSNSATPGTVTLDPRTGDRAFRGGASPLSEAASLPGAHPAKFEVRGERGRSYRVETADQVLAEGVETGASVAVVDLVVRSDSRPGEIGLGRLNTEGWDRFQVGGTLRLPANAKSDRYRAQIPVIVHYE